MSRNLTGMGNSNSALNRRLSDLERRLSLYREGNVIVLREDGKTKRCSVMLRGEGTADIDLDPDCLLGDLLADPENEDRFIIRPGYVSDGRSSVFLEKDNINPVIGDHLYVKVPWTAEQEDNILLSGGSMGTPTIEQGSSVPDDSSFTPTSLTGDHYEALGTWLDDGDGEPEWNPGGCGSITVGFCSNGKTGTFS